MDIIIFTLHNLAKRKYEILGKDFYFKEVSDKQIDEFYSRLVEIVPNAEIIEI